MEKQKYTVSQITKIQFKADVLAVEIDKPKKKYTLLGNGELNSGELVKVYYSSKEVLKCDTEWSLKKVSEGITIDIKPVIKSNEIINNPHSDSNLNLDEFFHVKTNPGYKMHRKYYFVRCYKNQIYYGIGARFL